MIDYVNMFESTHKNILALIKETSETINELSSRELIDKEQLINNYSDKLQRLTGSKVLKRYSEIDVNKLGSSDSEE